MTSFSRIGYASLLIILGLLYPFAASCRLISAEKELRQKELMKMMSVSEVSTRIERKSEDSSSDFLTFFTTSLRLKYHGF